MPELLAVVGDIHGELGRLLKVLQKLESHQRTTIFVGDYVNLGPDSKEVIDTLLEWREKRSERTVFLLGNHDLALIRYHHEGEFGPIARIGGASTIRSYTGTVSGDVHKAFRRSLPQTHESFFLNLEARYETEEILVSHAGYDPRNNSCRSQDALIYGHRTIFEQSAHPRPLVVCGHFVQRNNEPYFKNGLVCIDTGCGIGGPLTAVLIPEMEFLGG